MHKIITKFSLRRAIIIAIIIVLGVCLCINLFSKGDIYVFSRAVLV